MTVRVGIISAAWGAQAHLPAWRAVPGVEVVAICTAHRETAEAAAATYDVAMPFWDAAEMAAHPDVDLIDAGTRPNLRVGFCLDALNNGKHVYNAVPFAADLAGAKELRDAAAAHPGSVTAVDAYSQHFGSFRFAEELLAAGELGELHSVVGRLDQSLFVQPVSAFPYNWFNDATYGASAVRNLGSHLFHVIVQLAGPIDAVAGVATRYKDRWDWIDAEGGVDVGVADTGVASLRFDSGAIGAVTLSWASANGPGFHLELAGSKGRLVLQSEMMPSGMPTVLLGRGGAPISGGPLEPVEVPARLRSTEGVDLPEEHPGDPKPAMARSFWLMQQAIEAGGDARPDFERAYHVHSVIEAIYRSGEGAGWVRPADL